MLTYFFSDLEADDYDSDDDGIDELPATVGFDCASPCSESVCAKHLWDVADIIVAIESDQSLGFRYPRYWATHRL